MAVRLELTAAHGYGRGGKHTVVVKVVDIFGNDTTSVLEIDLE